MQYDKNGMVLGFSDVGGDSAPMLGMGSFPTIGTQPTTPPMPTMGFTYNPSARPEPRQFTAPDSDFTGYTPNVNYSGSSFGGIGAGIGSAFGPAGSAAGGVIGGAVDLYMGWRESEARKRAEKRRLEEARRQQNAARRREEADRRIQLQQAEQALGFKMADEARTAEQFDFNMKQARADQMRKSMINTIQDNQAIRDIFAKRGVV